MYDPREVLIFDDEEMAEVAVADFTGNSGEPFWWRVWQADHNSGWCDYGPFVSGWNNYLLKAAYREMTRGEG